MLCLGDLMAVYEETLSVQVSLGRDTQTQPMAVHYPSKVWKDGSGLSTHLYQREPDLCSAGVSASGGTRRILTRAVAGQAPFAQAARFQSLISHHQWETQRAV